MGSFSPGAAARTMALRRVWATPYCPACEGRAKLKGLEHPHPDGAFEELGGSPLPLREAKEPRSQLLLRRGWSTADLGERRRLFNPG